MNKEHTRFLWLLSSIVIIFFVLNSPLSTNAFTTSFSDTFSRYQNRYYSDDQTFGPWRVRFTGYGTVAVEAIKKNGCLHISPAVSVSSTTTHAGFVIGPTFSGPLQLQTKLLTLKQLRTGSIPNPWEVGWVIWNYTDDEHFYYFIPKTNGWELGKRDPMYPGGQRFLSTGTNMTFPIRSWYTIKIIQNTSHTIDVWVNGIKLTSFTDTEQPYTAGNIGFYAEDAHVHFDNVAVAQ